MKVVVFLWWIMYSVKRVFGDNPLTNGGDRLSSIDVAFDAL